MPGPDPSQFAAGLIAPAQPPAEVFAPPDSAETDSVALAQNPWRDTQGEPSLHDWLIGTSDEWQKVFSFDVGQWIQVIVQWAKDFIGWIKGQFEGVPQSAKTMGSGMDLMQCSDAIAQFIGAQLVAGANNGRVLSEGNWPQNFAGRIIAHGGALIEMVNLVPFCKSWKVRNTPAVGISRGDPALEYQVGPLPPPTGAPYTLPVIIQGFFAPKPIDPIAFQKQWGVPPPTPSQLKQLLTSQHKVAWNAHLQNSSTLAHMRDSFRDLWILAWKSWLEENIPPTPGQPPPPPNTTDCNDPCEIQVIEQLYSIAIQLQATNTPLMALIPWLPQLLTVLRGLSNPDATAALRDLADCVCGDLGQISQAVQQLAARRLGDESPDLKRIADALDPAGASNQQTLARYRSLINLLRANYGFPADIAGVLLNQ